MSSQPWRAITGRLYGRSGLLQIGPFDQVTPQRLANLAYASVTDPFADPAPFSDATVFAQPAAVGIVGAAAAVGARSLSFAYLGASAPQAGQYFGLGGVNLYLADGATNNGGALTVTFSPGLRVAAAVGDEIDFERPTALMRLMADDGGRAKLGIGFVADTTLDLVEAF